MMKLCGFCRVFLLLFMASASSAGSANTHAGAPLPQAGTSFKDCDDGCPTMVVLPAGRFTMGSPESEAERNDNEGPTHTVTIAHAFAVGETPVTVGQWSAFARETGYQTTGEDGFGCSATGSEPNIPQTDTHPVVCVNWNDGQAYAEWLSRKTSKRYRLLSEAEWEYAARAGTQEAYPFPGHEIGKYANSNPLDKADGWQYTSPVKSFPANRFGLYDMIGNVFEWTQDCWHDDYQGAPADGAAWSDQCTEGRARVLRGGSWYSHHPWYLRAASRASGRLTLRVNVSGLRVARSLP
jgi:formylglycine-generating enzyme required for sulfatase activity